MQLKIDSSQLDLFTDSVQPVLCLKYVSKGGHTLKDILMEYFLRKKNFMLAPKLCKIYVLKFSKHSISYSQA